MRIVCISDTHGKHDLIDVPDGDVLVHAGDFSSYGNHHEVCAFNEWLGRQPHAHKVVIAGNHEVGIEMVPELAKEITNAEYLNDSGTEIEGVRFWGSPITPTFFNWAFNRNRGSDIRKHWDSIPRHTDVLITHGPPSYVLDTSRAGSEHLGCADLMLAVDEIRPKLHVFGHIHGGSGERKIGDTVFVNASVLDEKYRPNGRGISVIEI